MAPDKISRYRQIREEIFKIVFMAEFYKGEELKGQVKYASSQLCERAAEPEEDIPAQKDGIRDSSEIPAGQTGENAASPAPDEARTKAQDARPDETDPEECPLLIEAGDIEYINRKSLNIIEKIEEIDGRINAAAHSWKTSRMGKAELAIMRIAVYEMDHEEDIPVSVSINEAVELAKKYGSSQSPAFINGVLAKLTGKPEALSDTESGI